MSNFYKYGVLGLFFFCTLGLSAQRTQDGSKIKALKIAFFTERLSLSSSEAEAFWPLYNEFEEKREALRQQQRREIYMKIDNPGQLSEAESKTLLNRYLDIEEEEEELEKAFYSRIAHTITAKKTLLLFKAEREFRKQLIKHIQQRKGSRDN